MRSSPRCLAKTRNGTPCMSPAVKGKHRCRMHGGAKGTGAPKGNQNALKHGAYTRESQEFFNEIRELLRSCSDTLLQLQNDELPRKNTNRKRRSGRD
ncbi:HGGxSTG domain-containing protein [Gymnodinialimonas hymeniacidonis]|uniref:HGGxSTG domain-containing protein n=1 Tax=Gymnodinialimonas hymeniacidonis TaxID=3126508 RepID=UPI0034C5FDBA